jgi:hypothetical protein
MEATNRTKGVDLTLAQVVGLLGIRSRVPRLEEDRFPSIIRLGIKQYLGASTPFAEDHKSRVDGNQSRYWTYLQIS